MIEVTFSDSTKGSLICATERENCFGDVVNIGFALDIGDISGKYDGAARREVLAKLWNPFDVNEREQKEIFEYQQIDMEKLLRAASNGEHIRIWKSDNPYSTCGFYFTCYLVSKLNCTISVVSLPEYTHIHEELIVSYNGWNQVDSDAFSKFVDQEKKVTNMEKQMLSWRWCALMEENSALRANINGRLLSVEEDFYDHLIIKNIPENSFYMAQLIGELSVKYYVGVSDSWYALRIDKMIAEKKLVVISHKDKSHPYGKLLRRA